MTERGPVPGDGRADALAGRPVIPAHERWILAVLVTVPLVLVALHTKAYTPVSPIDEFQHIDYLYRAADFEVVRAGDKVGEETKQEVFSRGLDATGTTVGDFNTAYVHPPTYYVVTGLVARLGPPVGLGFVTAGRLVGGLWMAAGFLLAWLALRRLDAGPLAFLAGAITLAASPTVLLASATVNPDATAVFVGGFALFATIRWIERRRGLVLLAVAGAAAGLTKLSNVVIVLAMGGLLVLLAWRERRSVESVTRRRPTPIVAAAVLIAAAALTSVAWLVTVRGLARVDPSTLPMSEQFEVSEFPVEELPGAVDDFITPVREPYIIPPLRSGITTYVVGIDGWVLGGGVLVALGFWRRDLVRWSMAAGVAATMVVGAPLFVVANYVTQHAYFDVPPRYGLALVVCFPALLALLRPRRDVSIALVIVASGLAISVGGLLVGAVV